MQFRKIIINNLLSGLRRVIAHSAFAMVVLASPVIHAQSAEMWLSKMNQAVHGLNDGRIDNMQIGHRVDDKGETERLLSLNGEAREILRDSEKVTCILPADKSVIISKYKAGAGLPALAPDNILKLAKLYDIELIGRDRIAGLPAIIIAIEPKDKMRYGYRIWLEEQSAMVLRSDILDANAKVMEQMMFTQITLQSPISAAMLASTVEYKGFRIITDKLATNTNSQPNHVGVWSFVRIPKGFKISSHALKPMPMKKNLVHHFLLSDGLASVSVYIEKSIAGDQALEGESRIGSVNAYGRHVSNHHVTVMGEVPGATVKQIAEAVTHN